MGVLCTIIGPASSLLSVPDTEIVEGGTIGPQSVGHDFFGANKPLDRFLQEVQCRFLVPGLGHEALKHLAFMVDGAPQVVPLAIDLHEHLLQVPAPAAGAHALDAAFPDLRSEQRAEPVPPKPHRLVADVDAALVQQILDVAERKREPDVHHDRQADDFRRRLAVAERGDLGHGQRLPSPSLRLKSGSLDSTVPPLRTSIGDLSHHSSQAKPRHMRLLLGSERLIRRPNSPVSAAKSPDIAPNRKLSISAFKALILLGYLG